jgi:ribonuclease P protein component
LARLSPISRHTPHLEADLPAERTSPEAPARLPRAHGDACGTRDPQAAARERAQAPVRLTRPFGSGIDVQRRHRLSRSRDFDAVYRHGRSVSTRFLVLYSFARDDDGPPRIGFAVPKGTGSAVVRNRVKRQLREAWRARLAEIPAGRDYVLIARPGLPEAAEARGFEWLGERIGEVLGKEGS